MMLGQRASGADWHFRKIALAGEDWGRITSYEGTATGSGKVSVVLSREPGGHREETRRASDSRENTTFSSPRRTTARGEFTRTSPPAGSLSHTNSSWDRGSPTTLSCPPAPRPPRRPSVPGPAMPAQRREARWRPAGASSPAGP